MTYSISISNEKVWISFGLDKHIEISNASDLETLKGAVDEKVALKILKEIHNLRRDKPPFSINLPKTILALAFLVAFFWLGTSHLYLLQSHFNPPSKESVITTSATPTGSFCPGAAAINPPTTQLDRPKGFDTTRMDQAIAQLEELKATSQEFASSANLNSKSQDGITDEEMEKTKYSFGYNN